MKLEEHGWAAMLFCICSDTFFTKKLFIKLKKSCEDYFIFIDCFIISEYQLN